MVTRQDSDTGLTALDDRYQGGGRYDRYDDRRGGRGGYDDRGYGRDRYDDRDRYRDR